MLPIAFRRRGRWYDPASLVETEFDRLFRRLRGEGLEPEEELAGAYPADVEETDGEIRVEAELPGFKRDEIEVTVDDDLLTISAERKTEEPKGKKHLSERRFTHVERSFRLPASVDQSQADARLQDGVLHLTLPKSGEAKPKRIELKE
ncbi:MAG: Hsp20/alpha crystallin family protein [Planctomycetota bacterium]